MSEPVIDTAREVFPVRFDGLKSRQVDKDLRPRPVRAEDYHITELIPPKAPTVPETATDLTDLVPDESAIQSSAPADEETETNPQQEADLAASLDQQPSSSPTTSTSDGSPKPPATPIVSPPTETTPTSSSPTRTKPTGATAPSPSTASPAPSAPSVKSTGK